MYCYCLCLHIYIYIDFPSTLPFFGWHLCPPNAWENHCQNRVRNMVRTSSSLEASKKVEVPVSPTSPKLKSGMLSDPVIHSTGGGHMN